MPHDERENLTDGRGDRGIENPCPGSGRGRAHDHRDHTAPVAEEKQSAEHRVLVVPNTPYGTPGAPTAGVRPRVPGELRKNGWWFRANGLLVIPPSERADIPIIDREISEHLKHCSEPIQ
jgi:hypothetical protein